MVMENVPVFLKDTWGYYNLVMLDPVTSWSMIDFLWTIFAPERFYRRQYTNQFYEHYPDEQTDCFMKLLSPIYLLQCFFKS